MKIALAQIDPTVGDFSGNLSKIVAFSERAASRGAELVMFPELAICGYPPADLIEKPSFLARCWEAVGELAARTSGLDCGILCGTVRPLGGPAGKRARNVAVFLERGRLIFEQAKMLLPFYDVFDEQRYFEPAEKQELFLWRGRRLAVTICEDAWNDKDFWPRQLYRRDPVEELIAAGAELVLNLSASPFWRGKRQLRRRMLASIAAAGGVPVLMANQVGGNDSLIFDGSSVALDGEGRLLAEAGCFREDLVCVDTAAAGTALAAGENRQPDADAAAENGETADAGETYAALVLGTRDYVRKCGFQKALVGLSGGIDSALVCSIAVDALGPESVQALGMPSRYSSPGSISDSRALAANLGIGFEVIPIAGICDAYAAALEPLFRGLAPDITEENIQSRARGAILMALSNKFGPLVLTTGNKSEMAVGYSTLYGDMVGALAVIGDVFKTRVYALSRFLNRDRERIPAAILAKPPSAELRPGQKDTDSLPEYEVLDPILEAYVERYQSPEQIAAARGLPLPLVREVVKMVERSEYKRQQAAPVLKVTAKSFGSGRRFPIAAKVQV